MRRVWLHFIKGYLKLGLFLYFRRISVEGLENIPKKEPTLILSNHQNALLDALIIATRLPRFAFFLTRAGVFKKKFVSKLLATFNMLPVYRIRDGWSNLTNNNPVFEKCSHLLSNNEMVTIFPEGSHNLARRVRPLSKGFTRIVFDTLEKFPNLELKLVPVGLNFQNALGFPDEAKLIIGKPITVAKADPNNRNSAVVELKTKVHENIRQFTTHISEEKYDQTIQTLNELNTDFLQPRIINSCLEENNFDDIPTRDTTLNGVRKFLKIISIINLILPYLFWKYWLEPKVVEIEFRSTFRFAVCLILVPIFWLTIIVMTTFIFGIESAMLYALLSFTLFFLTVKL